MPRADRRNRRRWRALVLALSAPWMLGGCDSLLGGEDAPARAVIEVEAEAPEPLVVVLSKDFQLVYDSNEGRTTALLLSADTTRVDPADFPFTATLDLSPENQFLARVMNPSLDTALVRLLVRMDGDLAHDRSVLIADSQYVEYNYQFVAR